MRGENTHVQLKIRTWLTNYPKFQKKVRKLVFNEPKMDISEQKSNVAGKRARGKMLTAAQKEIIYMRVRGENEKQGASESSKNIQTWVSPIRGIRRRVAD